MLLGLCPSDLNDPPDVLLLSKAGDCVGVEVTESVDAATVERHRQASRQD